MVRVSEETAGRCGACEAGEGEEAVFLSEKTSGRCEACEDDGEAVFHRRPCLGISFAGKRVMLSDWHLDPFFCTSDQVCAGLHNAFVL